MRTRFYLLFSALLTVSLALSACGATAATGTPAATEAPSTEAPATQAPTEPAITETPGPAGTLRVWTDEALAPVLEELADELLDLYNRELVVEVKSSIPGDLRAAAPGQGPDIVTMTHDRAAGLVADGLLAPVDPGSRREDFAPQALEACTFDGVLYCMPYAIEHLAFFYNTELVPTPPATWEEVLSIGEQLKADGRADYVLPVSGATYELYPLYSAFGGYLFGKSEDGGWNPEDLGLDSEGMVQAVTWAAENAANGNLTPDWDRESSRGLFESGRAPFLIDGPDALSRFREAGVPYAVAAFPGGGHSLARTHGFFISAQSQSVLLSQGFLNELVATEDTMLRLNEAGQRLPAYLPVLEQADEADLRALRQAGENAEMAPSLPAMDFVWERWNDAVLRARSGEQDPETALTEAADEIRARIANPLAGTVNVVGTYQAQAGCSADWQADCKATQMTQSDDGKWRSGPFSLTAGEYEVRVALDGSLETGYGLDGQQDGPNYTFTLAADGAVEFVFDPETGLLEIITG